MSREVAGKEMSQLAEKLHKVNGELNSIEKEEKTPSWILEEVFHSKEMAMQRMYRQMFSKYLLLFAVNVPWLRKMRGILEQRIRSPEHFGAKTAPELLLELEKLFRKEEMEARRFISARSKQICLRKP